MSGDTTPFIAANAALSEAAGYLQDMLLPAGHHDRQEDDDRVCLEYAVYYIDRAVRYLEVAGSEQVVEGGELADGCWIPNVRTEVVDPQAEDARATIETLAQPLRAWHQGGAVVTITQNLIDTISGALSTQFSGRLESERAFAEHQSDMADAASY